MKQKVCLVNSGVLQDYNCYFPIGLAHMATSCVKSSIDVTVIDPTSMNLNFNETVERILATGCKVVGLSGMLLQLKYSMDLTKAIKQKAPDIFTIMGGYQTIGLEEVILRNSPVDLVVMGEADTIFPELVHNLYADKDFRNTPGAVYRKGDDIIFDQRIPIFENLDDIERPLYEIFPMEKYIKNFYFGYPNKTIFYIMASRGCVFKCSFCVNSKRRLTLRYRDPENVRKEIRFLHKTYGVDDFFLLDENITSNKKWMKNIAEVIHGEGFSWTAMSRADMIDDEILEVLKSNGCTRLVMGIESGSDLILKKMNKKMTRKTYSSAFKMIRKHKIGIQANFMIGMPDDTLETLNDTERFCIENEITYAPNYVTPFPGTMLYDQVSDKIPPPMEYIDRLWKVEMRRWPPMHVSRFSNSQLIRIRTRMLVNTAANMVVKRFKFLPLRLARLACRALITFFDQLHKYPKLEREADYLINYFRQHFNR